MAIVRALPMLTAVVDEFEADKAFGVDDLGGHIKCPTFDRIRFILGSSVHDICI